MTKKHFIALADAIKKHKYVLFTNSQLTVLADFCKSQNPAFNKECWIDYINGKCGSNGGKVEK